MTIYHNLYNNNRHFTIPPQDTIQPPKDPRDPDYTRQGIFIHHNCSPCRNGKLPCKYGNANSCGNPIARND